MGGAACCWTLASEGVNTFLHKGGGREPSLTAHNCKQSPLSCVVSTVGIQISTRLHCLAVTNGNDLNLNKKSLLPHEAIETFAQSLNTKIKVYKQ